MLKKGPALASVRKESLEVRAQHLDTFFGSDDEAREVVNHMMLDDLRAIDSIDMQEFDAVAIFLQGRGLSKKAMREMLKKNPAAALVRLEELEFNARLVDTSFNAGVANRMMRDDLWKFFTMEPGEFEDCRSLAKVFFRES